MADKLTTPAEQRDSVRRPATDGLTEVEKAASVLIGYTMGAAVVLPFDRVKSLMQVDEAARKRGALGLAAWTVQTEGVRGLYRGGGVHMMIAPYTTFYYLLYDDIQARGRALTASPASPNGHHSVPLGGVLAFFFSAALPPSPCCRNPAARRPADPLNIATALRTLCLGDPPQAQGPGCT
jgi:hypothetical protein